MSDPGGRWPPPQWPPPTWPSGPYAEPLDPWTHPHGTARAYPQLLRTRSYSWWRPVVGVLVFAVGWLFVWQLLLIPVLAAVVAMQGDPIGQGVSEALNLTRVTPAAMLYLNLGLAGAIPMGWLVVRVVHRMRGRWLASVRPGIRWGFLFACFGVGVVALVAEVVAGALVPNTGGGITTHAVHAGGALVWLALVVLFTTPLQAIGEEYAFRGYLLQALGSLLNRSWPAILLSATVFALAHGVQNAPLFLDRFTFGLMAAFAAYRVGGLEGGIAMHVLNNLLAFGVALATGSMTSTLKVSQMGWWDLVPDLLQNGVFLVLVLVLARVMGLRRLSQPVAAAPSYAGPRAGSVLVDEPHPEAPASEG